MVKKENNKNLNEDLNDGVDATNQNVDERKISVSFDNPKKFHDNEEKKITFVNNRAENDINLDDLNQQLNNVDKDKITIVGIDSLPEEVRRQLLDVNKNSETKKGSPVNETSEVSLEEIQIRDENVQEILTKVPHWMIRWGSFLFFSLILLFLAISWFVKYPEYVEVNVTILNKFPNQEVVLEEDIKVKRFLAENNKKVNIHSPILIKENRANYNDIILLKSLLDSTNYNSERFVFPKEGLKEMSLGEIQTSFVRFQIKYQSYIKNLSSKEKYEQVLIAFNELKESIDSWEKQNTIKSNINGVIKWEFDLHNDFIEKGNLIAYIKNEKKPEYIAVGISNSFKSGKLKIGQNVQVSLFNYTEREFGTLNGKLKYLRWDRKSDGFQLIISLPDKLKTTFNKVIDSDYELKGTAKIILEDKRLITRFFEKL